MQLRLRFITDKGVHSDSQLSYLFLHHFGLDNGSTLKYVRSSLKHDDNTAAKTESSEISPAFSIVSMFCPIHYLKKGVFCPSG